MRSRLAFDSLWSRAANRADRLSLLGVRPIFSPWGQTDFLSLGSDRFRIFSAQAKISLLLSLGSDRFLSLGSDRFRIFSAQAKISLLGVRPIFSPWGQTDLEFSPLRPRARSSAMRSRLAFDSLWSRAANRADRLGTLSGARGQGSARARRGWPRYGASPGRRGQRGLASGSHARRVGPGRPRTGCTPPRSPGRDPILEAGVAPGAGRDGPDRRGAGADDPGIAHCRGAIHAVPRPTGGQAG